MTVNANTFGPAMLGVTSGITTFTVFLPKISEVRRAHPQDNPDIAADVRIGEVAASTLTLGVGVIASSLTGSPVPTVTAAVMVLVMIILYESTLRSNRPLEPRTLTLATITEGESHA
jgi:hypothetical protein